MVPMHDELVEPASSTPTAVSARATIAAIVGTPAGWVGHNAIHAVHAAVGLSEERQHLSHVVNQRRGPHVPCVPRQLHRCAAWIVVASILRPCEALQRMADGREDLQAVDELRSVPEEGVGMVDGKVQQEEQIEHLDPTDESTVPFACESAALSRSLVVVGQINALSVRFEPAGGPTAAAPAQPHAAPHRPLQGWVPQQGCESAEVVAMARGIDDELAVARRDLIRRPPLLRHRVQDLRSGVPPTRPIGSSG